MNPSPNCASPSFSVIFAANRWSSATSASVSVFLPSHCLGRCSGVTVLLAQTPWKSGWPSGVRSATHGLAWAETRRASGVESAAAATAIPAAMRRSEDRFMGALPSEEQYLNSEAEAHDDE